MQTMVQPIVDGVIKLFGFFGKKGKAEIRVEKHFIENPENQAKIKGLEQTCQNLQKELIQAKGMAQKMKDPKKYKQFRKEAFEMFLNNIRKLDFTECIPKANPNERHHVLIGNISVGKSSLINRACSTNLQVGIGETTTIASEVAVGGDVHIWDSPGMNDDFTFYDVQTLTFFYSTDRVFILYDSSLKTCDQIVKVLNIIKPNSTYLVRTKCDLCKQGMAKTIHEEIETDKKFLADRDIKLPILASSAQKPENYLDNAALFDLIRKK